MRQAQLVDPVGVIALLLVGLQRPVDGLLRVYGLLNSLPAYGGEPEPEGVCLRRGDGLDDTQDALGIGGLHLSLFAVRGEMCIRDRGNTHTESYRVYYDYYICTVKLENFDLSHLPVYMMDQETDRKSVV